MDAQGDGEKSMTSTRCLIIGLAPPAWAFVEVYPSEDIIEQNEALSLGGWMGSSETWFASWRVLSVYFCGACVLRHILWSGDLRPLGVAAMQRGNCTFRLFLFCCYGAEHEIGRFGCGSRLRSLFCIAMDDRLDVVFSPRLSRDYRYRRERPRTPLTVKSSDY